MKHWLFVVMSGMFHPVLLFSDNDPEVVATKFASVRGDKPADLKFLIPVGNSTMINTYMLHGRAINLPFPLFVVNSIGEMFFVDTYMTYLELEEEYFV